MLGRRIVLRLKGLSDGQQPNPTDNGEPVVGDSRQVCV